MKSTLLPKLPSAQGFHSPPWRLRLKSLTRRPPTLSFPLGPLTTCCFPSVLPLRFKWRVLAVTQSQTFPQRLSPVNQSKSTTLLLATTPPNHDFLMTLFDVWVPDFIEIYLLPCCLLHTNVSIIKGEILSALLLAIFLIPRTVLGTWKVPDKNGKWIYQLIN